MCLNAIRCTGDRRSNIANAWLDYTIGGSFDMCGPPNTASIGRLGILRHFPGFGLFLNLKANPSPPQRQ